MKMCSTTWGCYLCYWC